MDIHRNRFALPRETFEQLQCLLNLYLTSRIENASDVIITADYDARGAILNSTKLVKGDPLLVQQYRELVLLCYQRIRRLRGNRKDPRAKRRQGIKPGRETIEKLLSVIR